jgi:hypothetical protein
MKRLSLVQILSQQISRLLDGPLKIGMLSSQSSGKESFRRKSVDTVADLDSEPAMKKIKLDFNEGLKVININGEGVDRAYSGGDLDYSNGLMLAPMVRISTRECW